MFKLGVTFQFKLIIKTKSSENKTIGRKYTKNINNATFFHRFPDTCPTVSTHGGIKLLVVWGQECRQRAAEFYWS